MATDNKGVMVYLPSDLEEVLEKYCTENKITRKNKDGEPVASMGTGIVHYLRSHLLGITPGNLLAGITHDDVQSLIDQAITPLTSDLVNIQSRIIDRDNWDDMRADVADLREQLAQLTSTAKKPQPTAIRTPSAPGDINPEVIKVAARLEKEPKLKARIADGIAQGLTGGALGQWLADGGFLNKKGGVFEGASNSRFKLAIEHLNSLENRGEADG